MILELTNNTNSYSFEVEDLNYGEKLYYKFQIPATDVEDGKYNMILMDGDIVVAEEQVCIGNFKSETIQYNRGENIYIDVELKAKIEKNKEVTIDSIETTIIPNDGYDAIEDINVNAQPLYDSAFNDGFIDGKQNQKDLLEPIFIQTNGVYTNENGYSEITVDVPDTNGRWEDGFNDGKIVGYESGYTTGYNEGVTNAGDVIANDAIDLVATKFGTYYTKYSDNIQYPEVTGVFPDGENFYNDISIKNNQTYFSGEYQITPSSKIEIWWNNKNENNNLGSNNFIFGFKSFLSIFRPLYNSNYTAKFFSIDGISFTFEYVGWHHIVLSANGLFINDKKIGDFNINQGVRDVGNIFRINNYEPKETGANGSYGMIKIDDVIIIPTADGFLNTNTNELLNENNSAYVFSNNNLIILDNLIKSVDVQPKVDVADMDLKFGNSTFKKIPEIFEFSTVFDMSYMFNGGKLETLEGIDFSNATSLYNSFSYCPLKNLDYFNNYPNLTNIEKAFSNTHIEIVPDLDLSNIDNAVEAFGDCNNLIQVGNLNLEKARSLNSFLKSSNDNRPLTKIGILNVPNVEDMGDFFYYSFSPRTFPNITEMGGFIGLKCNWNDNGGLPQCPNLTYQSCINILNGLYDFTGNGETPTYNQGQLKVNSNFLTAVGDEISIGINKGWNITA